MKLHEILTEAPIKPQREFFRRTLEDHKDELQKSRTRVGIIRTLSRLFPDVDFRHFGHSSLRGRFDPDTNKVTVYNTSKMMTGENVRNNWDRFVRAMTELLTHEHIHKDQASRVNPDTVKEKENTLSKEEEKQLENRIMDLKHQQMETKDPRLLDQIEKRLSKLYKYAERKGKFMGRTHKDYLSLPEETMAFAEGIAHELVDHYQRAGYSKEQAKAAALDELRGNTDNVASRMFDQYRSNFPNDHRTTKRLRKQIAQYIQQI